MKRRIFMLAVSALIFVFSVSAYAAQWANPGLLMSAEDVGKNISKSDWVVIDCRNLEDYAKGHIPGAISLGKDCKKALRDGTSRVFKDASRYEKILGKVGIGNDTHVVFYGDSKSKTVESAAVGFWVLEYLGHGNVHVMNGGLDAWSKAGKPLATEPTIKQPATFKAKVMKDMIATTDEILQIAKGQKKGVQLIDSRSKGEYEGSDIRALRGGHVPNTTINIPHTETFDMAKDPATGKDKATPFLSPDAVEKAYASLDKNKRTIAYCQTGTRSTIAYLELRLLGFKNPANWDDSWIVWGSGIHKGYPVEDEQWLDLSKIKALEDEVKKLKEKLEEKK